MFIKKINVKNFKCFENKEISLSKLNFLQGSNGTGKTTISGDAIFFGFWGYSYTNLSSLPTRNKSESCKVIIDFVNGKDNYILKRSYPTHIKLEKNGAEVKFSTSVEANKYIEGIVGTREHFQKFQLINAYDKDADILSSGQTTIKKTLFSLTQDIFNNAKTKLQTIKSDRERLNKDGMTVYTHYFSEKRLSTLNKGIADIEKQYRDLVKEVNEFERDYNSENREKGSEEGKKSSYNLQKKKILSQPKTCYACKQPISDSNHKCQLTEIDGNIVELDKGIKIHDESLTMQKEIISTYKAQKDDINARISALNSLKTRLDARMKQKNLIYSTKDVLIVKEALNELDGLSSYYLKESIKVLEPIINSVLEKIGFTVKFTIDDKGKFAILYNKEGITYNQKDLSTGQATIMQIAFKLALLISQDKTGIIVADEGLGSLDSENLMHVVNIFECYPFQLFLVLHNAPDMPNSEIGRAHV